MPKDGQGSFKRLRTRRSRCERELPAPGWRARGTSVMGQLVSYRGSSVKRRKVHQAPLLAKIGNDARWQASALSFSWRATICYLRSVSRSSETSIVTSKMQPIGTRNRRLISRTRKRARRRKRDVPARARKHESANATLCREFRHISSFSGTRVCRC